MKTILLFLIATCFACTAHADTIASVADYQKYKAARDENWKAMLVYIVGMGEALEWANTYLSLNKRAPLFCTPERLHLNAQTLVSIIDDELVDERAGKGIKGQPSTSDHLEPVLLYGLVHTFPCKQAAAP